MTYCWINHSLYWIWAENKAVDDEVKLVPVRGSDKYIHPCIKSFVCWLTNPLASIHHRCAHLPSSIHSFLCGWVPLLREADLCFSEYLLLCRIMVATLFMYVPVKFYALPATRRCVSIMLTPVFSWRSQSAGYWGETASTSWLPSVYPLDCHDWMFH